MSAAKGKVRAAIAASKAAAGEPSGKPMSFREHLLELRKRLVRIIIVLLIGTFVTWEWRHELFDFLVRPVADALADHGIYRFQAIQITESVIVYVKVTLVGGLFIMSPYVFWELWGFIAPGLYSKEKRFILPLTGFSVVFFLLGAAFAYTIIVPFITDWLVSLSLEGGHVDVLVTLQNAYSFALMFLLMFGLVFQLPLVLFFLSLWGLVTAKGLLRFWRYFVVISFVVCGILTPPDPLSQTFMAVPVNVLYGFGVVVALTVARARAKNTENVSGRALRAMGISLIAALALTAAFFIILRGLPESPIIAWAPHDAPYVVGFNPRVLAEEKAVLGMVRGDPDAAAAIDAVAASGNQLADMTEGAIIATADGQRAVVLRGDDLGDRAAAIEAKLSDRHIAARALDGDTLALGPAAVVRGLAKVGAETTAEEDRLLQRLDKSGPAWIYVAAKSPIRSALLGPENAKDLGAFGGAIALDARRQLMIDLPVADDAAANRVEPRIEASRVAALAHTADARTSAIIAALKAVTGELVTLAPPADQPKLSAIDHQLDTLAPPAPPTTFPALFGLASHLRGVSVRREEHRLTVTSELDDEGLAALFAYLHDAATIGTSQ